MSTIRNGITYELERDNKTGRWIPMHLPIKLHKCPFDGGTVQMQMGWKGGGWNFTEPNGTYWAECIECGARGPCLDSEEHATEEWNSVF